MQWWYDRQVMSKLNYHHLYYFWQVARNGNLTRTAEQLHVAQSALSSQIRQLEHSMGCELFHREGRRLLLTESGHQAFRYAEEIFRRGSELESLLSGGQQPEHATIRIGTLATMSRNFIEGFISPLLNRDDCRYSLTSMSQTALLNALTDHQLDLALTNIEVQGSGQQIWQCQLLASQPVAVIGPPGLNLPERLDEHYTGQHWVLPPTPSPLRAAFDALAAQHQLQPEVVAEADDMAMLRLLARDSGALAVIPQVVVKDELASGSLHQYLTLPKVFENFYAVSVQRQLIHPRIHMLLTQYLTED